MLLYASLFSVADALTRINGLLTWIGRGFGIHALTLQLVIGYIFYPITFFLGKIEKKKTTIPPGWYIHPTGVPLDEILRVSQIIATKLVANEFSAYQELQVIQASDNPLTTRAFTIASYALCGFANLGSLGIQIGVLGALAPSRGKVIARIALSAMICGFVSTLQTAGIAWVEPPICYAFFFSFQYIQKKKKVWDVFCWHFDPKLSAVCWCKTKNRLLGAVFTNFAEFFFFFFFFLECYGLCFMRLTYNVCSENGFFFFFVISCINGACRLQNAHTFVFKKKILVQYLVDCNGRLDLTRTRAYTMYVCMHVCRGRFQSWLDPSVSWVRALSEYTESQSESVGIIQRRSKLVMIIVSHRHDLRWF